MTEYDIFVFAGIYIGFWLGSGEGQTVGSIDVRTLKGLEHSQYREEK